MGEYAERLRRKLAPKAGNLPTEEPKRRPGELLPGGIKDIPMLIKDGLDPIHAVYVFMQNFASQFAEFAAQLPEMKPWADAVEKAEDEYPVDDSEFLPLVEAALTAFETTGIDENVVEAVGEHAFHVYDQACKEAAPESTTAHNRQLMQSYLLGKRRKSRKR